MDQTTFVTFQFGLLKQFGIINILFTTVDMCVLCTSLNGFVNHDTSSSVNCFILSKYVHQC